jgi:hypothetical protein
MKVIAVVKLDLPPTELSPNGRAHWAEKASAVRAYRTKAWKSCTGPIEQVPVVVDVEYRWHKGCSGYKPRDEDNARASLKAAIDGLCDGGLIYRDSAKWLKWGTFELVTTCSETIRRGGPGVKITVKRREDGDDGAP